MYSYDLPYFADSSELFARIADLPQAVWLDSCAQFGSQGRYDIMAAEPQLQLRGTLEQLEIRTPHGHYQQSGDCFGFIAEQLAALPRELPQNLPFCGGLIGYFAYELGTGLGFNRVKTQQPNIPLDDINAGIYAWTLIQDHHSKRCWLLCLKTCPAAVREDIQRRCRSAAPVAEHGYRAGHFSANMSRAEYLAKLAVIDDYIHAGDCYQVNFAQRFSAEFSGSALAAYNQLRRQLPSPYSAFMQLDRGAILSHSPERFLRVQGERVDTKPIKGTIARGKTPAEDQALAKQLQNSIKDRAENLMIVDLLRNDLSRSCKLGSVRVPRLFALESYRNVHHLVSTVSASMRDDLEPLDVFERSFPGGSVTGAPKRRAMEIIAELEPHGRSVYCGSIAYISANGNMDSSIAIRTLVDDGQGQIHCWGGGAITADSDPESEYQESLTKVQILMDSLA